MIRNIMGLTVLTLMDYVCTCMYLLSSTIYLVQLILKYCHKLNIHRTQIKLVPAHILLTSFFASFLICVHNTRYLYPVNPNVITPIRSLHQQSLYIYNIYTYIYTYKHNPSILKIIFDNVIELERYLSTYG